MQVSQIVSSSSLNTANQDRECSRIPIKDLTSSSNNILHLFPCMEALGATMSHILEQMSMINIISQTATSWSYDSQMRQVPLHEKMGWTQLRGATQATNVMNSAKVWEAKFCQTIPSGFKVDLFSQLTNNSTLQQNSVAWQSATRAEQWRFVIDN